MGRFDGKSPALSVDLPSPRLSVKDTVAKFAERQLSLTDMVLLLGMENKHIFCILQVALSNLIHVYDTVVTLASAMN